MAKGKKKGKGKKGKSGKKGKKSEKKLAKELRIREQAAADSELWEERHQALVDTKNDYRQNAQDLALENELLMNLMRETETDTIDVVTFLKKEDQRKDRKVEQLEADLKKHKRHHRLEKQSLIDEFNQRIGGLEKQIAKKQEDIGLLQNELMHVKEFRKKRALMQRELDEIRENMFLSNREHKEESSRLEQKFLEERISLQKEADQKISELGDRAHQEAMANLDETTRQVYKENMSLAEQLSERIKEEELLKKLNHRLTSEHSLLSAEEENSKAVIKEKEIDSEKKSQKLKELNNNVDSLESILNHMIREFGCERSQLLQRCDVIHEESRQQILALQKEVEMKTKECSRVRKLAKKILTERNDIERFFLESLDHVKQEILLNQLEYKKAANKAYNRKMLEAFSGNAEFPKVRTFNKSDTSTNSVFRDLEAAEKLAQPSGGGRVDIADLTWEQKEKVLRYLFARMNGTTKLSSATRGPSTAVAGSMLQAAQKLPITHSGEVAGNVEADPFYDSNGNTAQPLFSSASNGLFNSEEFNDMLNKHSIVPEIGSRSQGIAT